MKARLKPLFLICHPSNERTAENTKAFIASLEQGFERPARRVLIQRCNFVLQSLQAEGCSHTQLLIIDLIKRSYAFPSDAHPDSSGEGHTSRCLFLSLFPNDQKAVCLISLISFLMSPKNGIGAIWSHLIVGTRLGLMSSNVTIILSS